MILYIKIFFLSLTASLYINQTVALSQTISPSPTPYTISPFSICGNRILEAGEQCDDGNNTDGDGCSASCTFEGRPPDALASSTTAASPPPTTISPTLQNCSCTDSTGTFPWNCTISVPPETRTCLEVCVEQANQNSGNYSASYYNSFE